MHDGLTKIDYVIRDLVTNRFCEKRKEDEKKSQTLPLDNHDHEILQMHQF